MPSPEPADGPSGGSGRIPDLEGIITALRRQLRPEPYRVLGRLDADVVFDAGDDGACTLVVRAGRVEVRPGRSRTATTTVRGDVGALDQIARGALSGVGAFLDDQIRVSGNLALALELDGIFDLPDRPDRFPRAELAEAAGVRTRYLDAGPPDAPVVVALHGLGATNASMLPTVWDLATDYRVLAPDLPGHGASSAPKVAYDAAFFARWLTALLDEAGVDRAVVIGNSLGGRISLEIALRAPDRVRGLVLLAPAVAFRRLRQLVPAVRLLRPELARLPLPMTAAMADAGLRTMFAHPERLSHAASRAASEEFVRVFRRRDHRVAFFSALRQIYLDDPFGADGFWRRLPSLEAPSLFVWGRRDRLVPAAFARHVATALPAARTVVLEDCGHVPQFEMAEETAKLIRTFLGELPPV
jgi:pimeloyl-ACP methyl ester carboxylesterase